MKNIREETEAAVIVWFTKGYLGESSISQRHGAAQGTTPSHRGQLAEALVMWLKVAETFQTNNQLAWNRIIWTLNTPN